MRRSITRHALLVLTFGGGVDRAGAQRGETAGVAVEGVVYDTSSGQPLRLVVIRVAGTGAWSSSDDEGRYRIHVSPGEVRFEVRRIGYEPASVSVVAGESVTRLDIYLHPLPIGLAPITVVAADDPARRIMERAIARKRDLYARIHDYRYDAYVKFVVRDLGKPADSAESVVLITEAQTSAYWQRPDRYQEVIVARRQSSNLDPEDNLVSVGEIVNFNRDRIDLGKYALVSPMADDALEHYDYATLDTLDVDGRRVFRLAIEPRSRTSPRFVGMIDIADSTYDVLTVEVGVNDAVRSDFLKNLRYRQRLHDAGDGRWMPAEIRFTAEVHIGMPLPGFPNHMSFEHSALLGGFRFDGGDPPPDLDEMRIVVDERADRADSAAWAARGAPELSDGERAGWERIDSLRNRPRTLGRRLSRGLGAALALSTDTTFFRFNRVDGAYLGAGRTWRRIPGVEIQSALGYATGGRTWHYRAGGAVRVSERRRLWIGASYGDQTVARPTLVSRAIDATYPALFFRLDPLDYYRERGLTVSLRMKVVDFTRVEVRFSDHRHSSLATATDYSLFAVDRPQRINPAVADGRLRSVSVTWTYDSREMMKDRGREEYLPRLRRTRVTLDAELNFAYRRYALQVERRHRTLGLGLTTITAAGGMATGRLPPQRYFTIDFGLEPVLFQQAGLNTLDETTFSGDRAALVTFQHDFDRLLFRKSGLPLLRSLPFTLAFHGATFWTRFAGDTTGAGDASLHTAPRAYSELGFGVGNLTPWIAPFNFAVHFTWQTSSYPTREFRFGVGLTGP